MKKMGFLLLLVLIMTSCSGEPDSSVVEETLDSTVVTVQDELEVEPVETIVEAILPSSNYGGAFFSVEYPEDFVIESEERDHVAFKAPDGRVIFSAYSPLWSGVGEIIMPQENELEVSREVEEFVVEESELGGGALKTITYITVKAKDGSYWRSIAEEKIILDAVETKKIFSVWYVDQDAYDWYKDDYVKFKNSLVQYADH